MWVDVGAPIGGVSGGLLRNKPIEIIVGHLLVIGFGLFLIYSGFGTWQRKRLIEDTPTETVAAAAAGRTELEGRGYPSDTPVTRPFSDKECLLATYKIEEENDGDEGEWKTVDSGTIAPAFELDDGTGQIRVEPDAGTTIKFENELEERFCVGDKEETPREVADFVEQYSSASTQDKSGITGYLFSRERRYTARWVPIGATLYLLGGIQPAGTDGAHDERVFRQDESSGEFIVSAKPVEDLIGNAMRVALAKGVGGLAVSAGGLYLFLSWLL